MRLNGQIIGEIIGDSVQLVGEGVLSKKLEKIMPRKISVWPENGYNFLLLLVDLLSRFRLFIVSESSFMLDREMG